MPYIDQSRRKPLDAGRLEMENVGDLTYVLTREIENYRLLHGTSFQTFAEILGALEAAKLELYRRKITNYENGKRLEHGDVYLP